MLIADKVKEAEADRRQAHVVPLTGRASSEPSAARSLPRGIQHRPRLVNVTQSAEQDERRSGSGIETKRRAHTDPRSG